VIPEEIQDWLAARESAPRVAPISFLDGLAPEAHYRRAAHVASRGGAPSISSGSIWATSLTNADDDRQPGRMLAVAYQMSRSCALSADDPSCVVNRPLHVGLKPGYRTKALKTQCRLADSSSE
jgi:hypothetical protein